MHSTNMNIINNWRKHSLEILEKENWGDPSEDDSNLIKRCMQLRKIPLDAFTAGDLRIMIGQQISLQYLIPLAIEVLQKGVFIDSELYEGDLLKNVLSVDTDFWNNNEAQWRQMKILLEPIREELTGHRISTEQFDNAVFDRE
jgi:hypothetical protein